MSFQFFLNEEQQARLEKMRSEFLAWKDESSKRIEEHMRRIKSSSTSRTSPASQSLPITPTSLTAPITKKEGRRRKSCQFLCRR
jgi:hypothetical protein